MTLRRFPEDFQVTEVLTDPVAAAMRSSGGTFAVVRVRKQSLTTPEAAGRLAGVLGVRPGHIDSAGLKDKHAVTEQHMWVRWPRDREAPEAGSRWAAGGIDAELIGWMDHAPGAAAIDHNRFEIVVRDLSRGAAAVMDERAAALMDGERGLLIVNYFGDQRFGSARHGGGFAGAALVRGDFIEAIRLLIAMPARKDTGTRRAFTRTAANAWGDWTRLARELPRCPERRSIEALAAGAEPRDAFTLLPNLQQTMAVEAFQSFLWNQTARRLVVELCGTGALEADDDFGAMVFPRPGSVSEFLRGSKLPMLGAESRLRAPWGEYAAAVMVEAGIEPGSDGAGGLAIPGLRRPALREAMRPLFVHAAAFSMSRAEPDETSKNPRVRVKRTLGFSLPRGAYATVVLRGLGE